MKCHCKPFLIKVVRRTKQGLAYDYEQPILLLIEPSKNMNFSDYFQLHRNWFPQDKSVLLLDDALVPMETRVDQIFSGLTFHFEKQPRV